MPRFDRRVLAVAALCGALAGCSGEDRTDTPREPAPSALTAAERRSVAGYERRIQEHCFRVASSLTDPSAAPSAAQQRRAFEAADRFGALAARKPTAELDVGQDLRLFLGDVIENLEGSNCDPRMRARLGEALRKIPVE